MNYFNFENNEIDKITLKNVSKPILPISNIKDKILEEVRNNQISIIIGETGSGKTTQIPQYLLKARLNNDLKIGVTQPRKIAAINMAKRVSYEMNAPLGIEVGYEVRFDKKTSPSTRICYMTDGILLNQCLSNPELSDYGIIIIDEAHERTVNTDTLMGILKVAAKQNNKLKIIITSATLETKKFSRYFNNANLIVSEGKMYPVEVIYKELIYNDSIWKLCVDLVIQIHKNEAKGDILVFLTGQDRIEECYEYLENVDENLKVLRLYGALEYEEQQCVFDAALPGQRKVILATNIAETSITVEGVRYVIDCGYVKQNEYDSKLRIETLKEVRISKSQADQRKGRAGRIETGKCYRLYSKRTYEEMESETKPDIYRQNLIEVYLKLCLLGISPLKFEFIDAPEDKVLINCRDQLIDLDLLDSGGRPTELGRKLGDFPVDPVIGKILLASEENGCAKDVAIILSMLTEKHIFIRGKKKVQKIADQKKTKFFDSTGDYLTYLNVYKGWINSGYSNSWCKENFINDKSLQKVKQALEQLSQIMSQKGMRFYSVDSTCTEGKDKIIKSFIKGFYRNICKRKSQGIYVCCTNGEIVYTHPASSVFHLCPDIIIYNEVVKTTKPYIHGVSIISGAMMTQFPVESRKIRFNELNIHVVNKMFADIAL